MRQFAIALRVISDITGLVGAGGNFVLRFAEVNNRAPLSLGVDNVSIEFTAATVPEPTNFTLCAGLLLTSAIAARVRRGRAKR